MADNLGISFRSTYAYVTNPANNTGSQTGDIGAGPLTRDGITFTISGFVNGGFADRNAGIDTRLAGIAFAENASTQGTIRLNMSTSGSKDITLALGDDTGAQGRQYCEVWDGDPAGAGVLLWTVDVASVAQSHWIDATGVDRTSAADWASNNLKKTLTFSTSNCYIRVGKGNGVGSTYTVISHVHIIDTPILSPKRSRFLTMFPV